MSKVYCQGCFAEIPDYAHFCHLCGARQPDRSAGSSSRNHGGTPLPAPKNFDTEFAPASAGNPHGDDVTLPVSRATFQTGPNNGSSVVSPARPSTKYADTPPLVPSVVPLSASFSPRNVSPALSDEEYKDPYYAALRAKEDLDEIAGRSTVVVKKVDIILPVPIQAGASAPQRAEHQQPQALRAEHQQPQMVRASHRLPQSIRVVHKQPVKSIQAFFATHAQVARYSLISTCVVLLVGIVVLLTNPFAHTNAQVGMPSSPTLTTMNATSVFPGGSVTLHGANFTPNAVVAFSTDGSNLALASAQPSALPANAATISSLADVALSARLAHLQKADLDARVQYDGTFDVALSIPRSWQANSIHRIQAKESSSGKIAFVDVKVLVQKYTNSTKAVPKPTPMATSAPPPQQQQASRPEPTPAPVTSYPASQQPASEPTPTPDIVPLPKQQPQPTQQPIPRSTTAPAPVLKPFCLSMDSDSLNFSATIRGGDPDGQVVSLHDAATCESGDWSASSDAPWLSVSPGGGHIPSGKNALIHITTSIANLKPGSYTGHISVSPGSKVIAVSLNVQLVATCITAQASQLLFTSSASPAGYYEHGWTVQQPADQVATIGNGGDCDAGSWIVSADAKWLTVTPNTGKIARGGNAAATVHVSDGGLNVNTPYTGHLTFDAGSSKATVTVILNITQKKLAVTPTVAPPLAACLVARTSALNFSSQVGARGASQPDDQTATVVNGNTCGAANWTVSSDAPWLSVKGGGYIEANGAGDAIAHVALDGLDTSKNYTGHLIFVAGSSKVTVPVNLGFTRLVEPPTPMPVQPTPIPVKPTPVPVQPTLVVQPTPVPVKPTPIPVQPTPIPVKPTPVPPALTQCLSVDQASLAFKGAVGYKGYDPLAQTITVTNCGSMGIVTAAVSSDSLSWLAASGGGQLVSGAKTYIRVSVDAIRSGLKPGPHSGIVYITVKTSDGNTKNIAINISFNVTSTSQPAPTPLPQPTPRPQPTPTPQPQPTQPPRAQPTKLQENQG